MLSGVSFQARHRTEVECCIANIITEICCDPCRCHICDRRTNGMKSMLKPASNGRQTSQPQTFRAHSAVLDNRPQAQSNPGSSSRRPHESGTITEWEDFANGGVQADDAMALLMRKEQEAQFLENVRSVTPLPRNPSLPIKLVQISPDKAPGLRDTNLLVDLDVEPNGQLVQHHYHTENLSYAKIASSLMNQGNDGANMNLLD